MANFQIFSPVRLPFRHTGGSGKETATRRQRASGRFEDNHAPKPQTTGELFQVSAKPQVAAVQTAESLGKTEKIIADLQRFLA